MMHLHWPEVTADEYEQLRPVVNWEGDVPEGLLLHVSAFDDGGAIITDVWESQEQFQRFLETRLMPGFEQVGMQGQPQVEFHPLHAVFAPGV
jgi:hypothetical protein